MTERNQSGSHQTLAKRRRYRELFEQAPDSYLITDTNGVIQDANDSLATMLCVTPESLLGRSLATYVSPGDRQLFHTELARLQNTEWDQVWETHLQPRIGPAVAVIMTVAAAHDEGGRLVGFRWLVRDINERKRAEDALRRRADELAALTRVGREIMYVRDLNQVFTSIARHAAQLSHSDAGGVYSFLPDGALYIAASYGIGEQFVEAINARGIAPGQGAIGWAVAERCPVQVPDTMTESSYAFRHLTEMEQIRAVLAVPMLRETRVIGGIVLWHRTPRRFAPLEVAFLQALAQQCVNAVANAHLFEAEARRRQEAETLREIASALNTSLHREQMLHLILEQLARVVDYDSTSIMLVSNGIVDIVAYRGLPDDVRQFMPQQVDNLPHVGEVLQTRLPVIIPNTAADPRWQHHFHTRQIRCWLGVPLVIQDRVIGLLNLDSQQTGFYSEREAQLTMAFAHQAAAAIENARLLDAIERHRQGLQRLSAQLINSQEAERKRIARELHDEMGQALTAMRINLAAIEKELPAEIKLTIGDRLTETSWLADQTLERVRELSFDLRPSILDELGLVETLDWYVERFAKRLNIEASFEAVGLEERLPAEIETVIYRVAQEGLTNIAKHAQAQRISLALKRSESKVSVTIEDDGQGFDWQKVAGSEFPDRGVGLLGMRERASVVGGRLRVRSRPGQGTRLYVELPAPRCS